MPVLLHTRTGICRSFKSYQLAFMWVHERREHEKFIFTCPEDFDKIAMSGRETLWPRITEWCEWRWHKQKKDLTKRVIPWEEFSSRSRAAQDNYLWYVVNHIADPVTVMPQWMIGEVVTVDVDLCQILLTKKEWIVMDIKSPRAEPKLQRPGNQLITLVKALQSSDHEYMTESELEKYIRSYAVTKMLNTSQDNWRIFRYYRPVLEQLGVLR